MQRFTQQELMNAHNVARHNAELDAVANATNGTVPTPVNPYKKAQPWPDTEHPFGNNANNQRVALRIAREGASAGRDDSKAPLSPVEAAIADLRAAEQHNDNEELSEDEQERRADADLAEAITGKDSAKPVAPAKPPKPPKPIDPPAWTPMA